MCSTADLIQVMDQKSPTNMPYGDINYQIDQALDRLGNSFKDNSKISDQGAKVLYSVLPSDKNKEKFTKYQGQTYKSSATNPFID